MAKISQELLDSEWETYNGLRYFLKNKELLFGQEMNTKYLLRDKSLEDLNDWDAYYAIKKDHTFKLPEK